ncbi:MAG: alpha/beta hydrolase [Proteobacteria bacterium]|nr:MAG: alpha/beta hydrolase [Pseudomonadota bacterium]
MFRPTKFLALLLNLLPVSVGAAGSIAEPADPFPDTPQNREIYESSFQDYKRLTRAHGHYADVNGIRMHYLEWGGKGGIPLVWSHGYGSTGYELIEVGPKLADMGYHVFAITYRGHGQTQVTNYDFSLAHIADDIAAFLDQKSMPCAVIGGLSLGGAVATTFYENYPQRVMALVLEDGGADVIQHRIEKAFTRIKDTTEKEPGPDKQFSDRFLAFRRAVIPLLPMWQGRLPLAIAPAFHSFVIADGEQHWRFHVEDARLLGEGGASDDPSRSHELPLLAQSWRRVHPIVTYRNLSMPMLIIDPTGDDGGPYGSFTPSFEELRALHPDLIRLVEYPAAPHPAHAVRPDWFLRDMKELMDRVHKSQSNRCLAPLN